MSKDGKFWIAFWAIVCTYWLVTTCINGYVKIRVAETTAAPAEVRK